MQVHSQVQQAPSKTAQDELAADYAQALEDLTFNSKPIITTLTQIAHEHIESSDVIAKVIINRIRSVSVLAFCLLICLGATSAEVALIVLAGLHREEYWRTLHRRVLPVNRFFFL